MSEITVEGQRKLRIASDEEIAQIIGLVAQTALEKNKGYFSAYQVEEALDAAGINSHAVPWKKLLKQTFHVDPFAPKQDYEGKPHLKPPFNARDPVKPEPTSNPLVGMPDLTTTSRVIHAEYRPEGQKVGGISRKAPKSS